MHGGSSAGITGSSASVVGGVTTAAEGGDVQIAAGAGQRACEARRPRRGVVAELNHMRAETTHVVRAGNDIVDPHRDYLNIGAAEIHFEPRVCWAFGVTACIGWVGGHVAVIAFGCIMFSGILVCAAHPHA